jgi:hypothetical protein
MSGTPIHAARSWGMSWRKIDRELDAIPTRLKVPA